MTTKVARRDWIRDRRRQGRRTTRRRERPFGQSTSDVLTARLATSHCITGKCQFLTWAMGGTVV